MCKKSSIDLHYIYYVRGRCGKSARETTDRQRFRVRARGFWFQELFKSQRVLVVETPFSALVASCLPSEQEAEGSRSIRRVFIRSHARPGSRSQ